MCCHSRQSVADPSLPDIANHIGYFVKAVDTQEPRYSFRALRKLNTLRKKLTPEILQQAIVAHYPQAGGTKAKQPMNHLDLQCCTRVRPRCCRAGLPLTVVPLQTPA